MTNSSVNVFGENESKANFNLKHFTWTFSSTLARRVKMEDMSGKCRTSGRPSPISLYKRHVRCTV